MITLRGITWENPRGYDPLVAAAEAWMTDNPSCEIIWEQLPWYQFEDKILASLAAEEAYYDLIMFDHPWVGKLSSEGWLIPLDELYGPEYVQQLEKRIIAPSVESYEWDGHLWALPLDAASHAALYRSDLVDGHNLPITWEAVGKWVQEYHHPPHQYGLVLSLEGVLGNCLFLSMMAGLGHAPYLDEANPTFDHTAAEYVLTLVKSLISYTPPGSTHWGPWDIFEHISNQNDVGYSPSIFAYVNYFSGRPHAHHLKLGPVPAFAGQSFGRPILGGVGLGISSTCRNVEEAGRYARYLASDDVQRRVFPNNSGQPAARIAWRDVEINFAANQFYMDLSTNMKSAYIRPRYPAFHHIELRNGAILQQWWDDELSLRETIERLDQVSRLR